MWLLSVITHMQQHVAIWHTEGSFISDFGKVSVKSWKLFQGSLWAISGYTGRSCQQLMDNQFSHLVHCAVDAVKTATGFTLSFKQRTVFFNSPVSVPVSPLCVQHASRLLGMLKIPCPLSERRRRPNSWWHWNAKYSKQQLWLLTQFFFLILWKLNSFIRE